MKFEKQFPSLKYDIIDFSSRYKAIGKCCRCKDIKKHCLDKKKVIDTFRSIIDGEGDMSLCKQVYELGITKSELGLENDME